MNRNDFKEMAHIRFKEAKVLVENESYDGAYYLCGYVIECGLEACIAKQVKKFDFPNRNTAQNCYTHDLIKLINTAGLTSDLQQEMSSNVDFRINWTLVKDWSEESRYQKHTKQEAEDLYSAIAHRKNRVFIWIRRRW